MSTFTCRNGHVVSIKDKFCPICGLPIRYMDGKEEPVTYEEYVRNLKLNKRKLRKIMESQVPLLILPSRLKLGRKE